MSYSELQPLPKWECSRCGNQWHGPLLRSSKICHRCDGDADIVGHHEFHSMNGKKQ